METILQKYDDKRPIYGHYALLNSGETGFIVINNYKESNLSPEQVCEVSERLFGITDSLWTRGFSMLPTDLHLKFIEFGLDNIFNEDLSEEDVELMATLDYYFNKTV